MRIPVKLAALTATVATAFAGAAFGQNVAYGPVSSGVENTPLVVPITVPTTAAGAASLEVNIAADIDQAGEFVTVSVEGTTIGTLQALGVLNCVTFNSTLAIADIAPAAADGTVTVTFTPSFGVGITNQVNDCTTGTLPSTTFSGGFGVEGVLSVTTPSGGGGAGASGQDDMAANRGALIVSSSLQTPRRIERLQSGSGLLPGQLSFMGAPVTSGIGADVSVSQGAANFATGFDAGNAILWAEGQIVSFSDDLSDDGRFGILHLGADWFASPDLLIGVALQLDYYDQDTTAGEAFEGTGLMLGPVLTARLAQDLYLDGRLAFGRAENEITRSGGNRSLRQHPGPARDRDDGRA